MAKHAVTRDGATDYFMGLGYRADVAREMADELLSALAKRPAVDSDETVVLDYVLNKRRVASDPEVAHFHAHRIAMGLTYIPSPSQMVADNIGALERYRKTNKALAATIVVALIVAGLWVVGAGIYRAKREREQRDLIADQSKQIQVLKDQLTAIKAGQEALAGAVNKLVTDLNPNRVKNNVPLTPGAALGEIYDYETQAAQKLAAATATNGDRLKSADEQRLMRIVVQALVPELAKLFTKQDGGELKRAVNAHTTTEIARAKTKVVVHPPTPRR